MKNTTQQCVHHRDRAGPGHPQARGGATVNFVTAEGGIDPLYVSYLHFCKQGSGRLHTVRRERERSPGALLDN